MDLGKKLLEAAKMGHDEEVRILMANGAPFTTDWVRPGFFSGRTGVPPSGENFVNSPHPTPVPVFGPRLAPQLRFIPKNLKNLNTFLCQI